MLRKGFAGTLSADKNLESLWFPSLEIPPDISNARTPDSIRHQQPTTAMDNPLAHVDALSVLFCHACHEERNISCFRSEMYCRDIRESIVCSDCWWGRKDPRTAALIPLAPRIEEISASASMNADHHRSYYGAAGAGAGVGFSAAEDKVKFYESLTDLECAVVTCPYCGQELSGFAMLHRHVGDSIVHSTCPVERAGRKQRPSAGRGLELLCPGRFLHAGRCQKRVDYVGDGIPVRTASLAVCKTCRLLAFFMGKVPFNAASLDFSDHSPLLNFLGRTSRLPVASRRMPPAYRDSLVAEIDERVGPSSTNRAATLGAGQRALASDEVFRARILSELAHGNKDVTDLIEGHFMYIDAEFVQSGLKPSASM